MNYEDALKIVPESVRNIMLNTALTPHQRMKQARPILNNLVKRDEKLVKELKVKRDENDRLLRGVDANLVGLEWMKLPPKLERNDCSRFHHLADAFADGMVVGDDYVLDPHSVTDKFFKGHVFVVQNDWAAAFSGATDYSDGEFKYPFDHCIFEFRISGRTVIALCGAPDLHPGLNGLFFPLVEVDGYWVNIPAVYDFVANQVRAICIALDSEVAVHEVVRAPYKLNEKRVKDGKRPLSDFSVVKLANRVRCTSIGSGEGTRKRLHFRRGHWRHYAEHKTWVRWTLVGNPDLGFINKSYTL